MATPRASKRRPKNAKASTPSPKAAPPAPRTGSLLVAISWALSAAALLLFLRFTAEDAYVTARYAENLARDGALVFNAGERVSALTSPAHALFESALVLVTGSSILAWKVMSMILFVVQGILVLRRLRAPWSRAVVAPIILLSPCMVLWAVGGMETPLLSFAATIATLAALHPDPPTFRRATLAFVAGGIAFLTRFDSILFVAPVLAAVFWRARDNRARWLAPLLGAVAPTAWLLFAHGYYGTILPTSYYVKNLLWNAESMQQNANYMVQGLILVGLVPACALLFFRRGTRSNGHRFMAPAIGLGCGFLLLFVYGLAMATHHMMFTFRYVAPYVASASLWIGTRLDTRNPTRVFLRTASGLAALWTLLQVAHLAFTYGTSINGFAIGVGEYAKTSAHVYASGFLRALESGATDARRHWARVGGSKPPRIVTFAAGALPFRYREAYVFEQLVSYREGYAVSLGFVRITDNAMRTGKRTTVRKFDATLCGDYLHIMVPGHGSPEAQLPKPIESYELISDRRIQLEGREQSLRIYYDPSPLPAVLPPRVGG